MAVLTDKTGTLIVVKTLFVAFGELKPILDVVKVGGRLGNHRDEDDSDPLMVQQHHDQEHEDERAHHVQHCGPHGRGTGHLIGVCAVVGSPEHGLAPVTPEDRQSTFFPQSAPHLQLIPGTAGGQVDAVILLPNTDMIRRPLPVVDPVANLTLHTTGLYLTPLEPQVGVGSVPDCHARWWI